jgi:hypothetical protein
MCDDISMDADEIINDYLKNQMQFLEQQIEDKGELLDFFMAIHKENDDNIVTDQIALITTDLDILIKQLLDIRRDSEFTNQATQGIIDKMGNIKHVAREKLIENFRSKYYWQD